MKFKDYTDFKNQIASMVINKDIPDNFIINGWVFEKLSGKILRTQPFNIQDWELIYINKQIKQSILLNITVRYIKSKDQFRIKRINSIELY